MIAFFSLAFFLVILNNFEKYAVKSTRTSNQYTLLPLVFDTHLSVCQSFLRNQLYAALCCKVSVSIAISVPA